MDNTNIIYIVLGLVSIAAVITVWLTFRQFCRIIKEDRRRKAEAARRRGCKGLCAHKPDVYGGGRHWPKARKETK